MKGSGQEPRLTCHLSGDEKMLEAYLTKKDLYAVIAQSAFNNDYADNLEFAPSGAIVTVGDHQVISGDGQEYTLETEGNKLIIDYYMLVPTTKGDIQASLLEPGNEVITEENLYKIKSIETSNKKTIILFEEN